MLNITILSHILLYLLILWGITTWAGTIWIISKTNIEKIKHTGIYLGFLLYESLFIFFLIWGSLIYTLLNKI